MGIGYNKKMIRKQILSAPEHSRNDLLEKEKQQMSEKKLTFNITYYPAFSKCYEYNGGTACIVNS